jgi:hypothetical protein
MEDIKCSKCEEYKNPNDFFGDKKAPDARYNKHYWCKKCFLSRQKKQPYHRKETESRFITRIVQSCRASARGREKKDKKNNEDKKSRGECTIDREMLLKLKEKQNNKCAISGVELVWKHHSKNKTSIDRIDCDKGYTEDNIRLVTQQINYAMSNFEYDWFLDMCKNVVKHNNLL